MHAQNTGIFRRLARWGDKHFGTITDYKVEVFLNGFNLIHKVVLKFSLIGTKDLVGIIMIYASCLIYKLKEISSVLYLGTLHGSV